MNKETISSKGFTLIELLAVIIILSVVSIIATPIILDVVDNSKSSVSKSTAYNIIDAANLYYTESLLDSTKALKVNAVNDIYGDITVSGSKPSGGKLYVNSNGLTALSVIIDGKCYIKEFAGELEVLDSDTCDLGYVGNDSTNPTVSISTSSIKTNDWYKENLYMDILVTDLDSGASSYKYCIDSIECEPSYTIDSYEGSSYITLERINYLCVIGYDLAGNHTERMCEVIKLDKTAPEFSGIPDVTIQKDSSIDLSNGVSAIDGLSGVNGIYTYNPTSIDTSVAGTTNVTYSVSDIAGNNNTITRKIIVDAEAPTVTFSNDYEWHKENFYATATIVDNSGTGIKEAKWCTIQGDTCMPNTIGTNIQPLISVEHNNNRICVQATDNNNKTSEVICSDAYKLDKTAPIPGTFNIAGTLGTNGWYTSDVSISANNGSDSLSGHDSSSVNISSITTNTAGTTVTLTTTDVAGNTATRITTIKVDKNAPTVTAHPTSVNVIQGASNAVSSYFSTIYSISSGTLSCSPINTSSLSVGTQTVSCTANGNNGKTATVSKSITVRAAEYTDGSGANKPILFANMIPVTYNGSNWVYADKSTTWYNYTNKQWANAVVLNNGISKNVGDTLNIDTDVAQMYVWIPRYKYTIFNGYRDGVPVQEINVTFESGTTRTGTVTCTDNIGTQITSEICIDSTNGSVTNGTSTYTHPAFKLGTTELTGIWVGKFENSAASVESNTEQTVLIKPNVISWRNANVSTFYTSIKNIASNYGITTADSHMMKNMEWGAVAYLKQSKYGLGTTDIGTNNNSSYMTGCGATAGSNESLTCNAYNTTTGMLASTTGNIYGVYDMSGGTLEYVMGNTAFSSTSPIVGRDSIVTSNFSGKYYDGLTGSGIYNFPDYKYTNMYSYDSSSNTTHSRGKLGDATKETIVTYRSDTGGWYSDCAYFPYFSSSWFLRGGGCRNDAYAGVFFFSDSFGSASSDYAARSVLVSDN